MDVITNQEANELGVSVNTTKKAQKNGNKVDTAAASLPVLIIHHAKALLPSLPTPLNFGSSAWRKERWNEAGPGR